MSTPGGNETTSNVSRLDITGLHLGHVDVVGAGIRGPRGDKGEPGVPGPKGDQGDRGEQGPLGEVGPRGADGTPGPAGADGAPGAQGEPGVPGPKGADSTVPGPQGPVGPKGADGKSVTIVGSVANTAELPTNLTQDDAGSGYITENDGHMHVWSGTSFTDVGTVRGPQGPAGPEGQVGPASTVPGPAGPAGAAGAPGAKGDKGEPGEAGPAGPGVPAGGGTGQVLAKASTADYATTWTDAAAAAPANMATTDTAQTFSNKTLIQPVIQSTVDPSEAGVDSGPVAQFKNAAGALLAEVSPVNAAAPTLAASRISGHTMVAQSVLGAGSADAITSGGGHLRVVTASPTTRAVTIRTAASQTANIMEVQDSAGVNQTVILPDGSINMLSTKYLSTGRLRAVSTTDLSPTSTGHGFQVGPDTGANLRADVNEIFAMNNGVAAALTLGGEADVNLGLSNDGSWSRLKIGIHPDDLSTLLRTNKSGFNTAIKLAPLHVRSTNAAGTSYVPHWASSFDVASSEEVKENIEPLPYSALEAVNNAPVSKWNYASQIEEADNVHVGPMAEALPAEITRSADDPNEPTRVSLHSMIGLLWGAVQELTAQVDDLKAQLQTQEGTA